MRWRRGEEDGKSLENPERQPAAWQEEGLPSQRMPASPPGCKSYLVRAVLLMHHLSASLGRRPQAGLLSEAAGARRAPAAESTPWAGRAPRRGKWMLFPDQPAQWHRLPVREARSEPGWAELSGAEPSCSPLSAETSSEAHKHGAGTGLGEGALITGTISQLCERHKERDRAGAAVTFWCRRKAVNGRGNILVLIKGERPAGERERDGRRARLQLN